MAPSQWSLVVASALLAACYQPTTQPSCAIGCVAGGVCPSGLTCGADLLCHSGTDDCSEQVTGTFGHQLITNDGSGNPLATDLVYGRDQLEVSAVLSDTGAAPAIAFDADNSFGFSRMTTTEPYNLSVRPFLETTVATETQDAVPMVTLRTPYFGRISRTGVGATTDVALTLTGTPPARGYISSTGLRTFSSVPIVTPATTLKVTYVWANATSLYGGLGLLDASQGDVLWYNGYDETIDVANAANDYWSIVGSISQMVTMTSGKTLAISGPLAPVTQSCVALTLPHATELARVEGDSAFYSGSGSASAWNMTSVPFAEISPSAGIEIVFPESNAALVDQQLTVDYANPYPEDQVAVMTATFTRKPLLPTTMTGPTLTYGTTQYAQIPTAPESECPVITLNAMVAMPSTPSLGGTTLDTDNQVVTLDRSGPILLSFPQVDGNVDDYVVVLEEAMVAGTATVLDEVHAYSTTTSSAAIDPTLLLAGHSYIFQVSARLGYPNAATRDYRTITYPFGTGTIYSAIFQVGS